MNESALRADRRKQSWKRPLAVSFLVSSAVALVVALSLLAPVVFSGSSPSSVAAPSGTATPTSKPLEPVAVTPTPTPTESATPTPEPIAAPLQSLPAYLTVPKAGIAGQPITLVDPARDIQNGMVVPPEMGSIVWDTTLDPTSTLTSESPSTAAVYCHAYTEENPGVCQHLRDVVVGDVLVVETPTERLTYLATMDPMPVPKLDAPYDPGFTANAPQTIQVITCDREGEIDETDHAVSNLYIVFKLESVERIG